MKKSPLLLGLFFTLLSLSSCHKKEEPFEKVNITFGSYYDEYTTEIDTYEELRQKIIDEQENCLVALHYGANSSCSCWRNFSRQLNNYIKENHIRVYTFDSFKLVDQENTFGFTLLTRDEPSLFLLSKGKVVKSYLYSNKDLKEFFEDENKIKEELDKVINMPSLYYVDQEYASSLKNNSSKSIIFFMRSGCGDCSYCLPNLLMPYCSSKILTSKIYLFDMQDLWQDAQDNGSLAYQETKNFFNLSEGSNSTYGYEQGVVPTIQIYENKTLKDVCVYFNDTVSKIDNQYVISSSFYSQKRKGSLSYLENVETKVLEGMILSNDDVIDYAPDYDYITWKQTKAAIYHNAFMTAFLDYYAK